MFRLYAALCVLGAMLPLAFLGSFVADEGIDPAAFWDEVNASNLSRMAWADVAVAGAVVIVLAARERRWAPVAGTLLVGPSLGLPLLLLLRERAP